VYGVSYLLEIIDSLIAVDRAFLTENRYVLGAATISFYSYCFVL